MKERIIQPKKTTADSFSIPSLKQPIRGFGSQPSAASSSAVLDNSLVHDISRIPLRRPQTKLTINQPGDMYEQQADAVAHEVMGRLGQPGNSSSIHIREVDPIQNTGSSDMLQRLPTDEIIVDSTYEYINQDNKKSQGKLIEIKPGGWYIFDNGKAHGKNNVIKKINIEEGSEESSESVEPPKKKPKPGVEQEATLVRDMFIKYLNESGITDQGQRNLLVELNEEAIQDAKNFGVLDSYLENWTDYTACYATAEHLFNLLGTGEKTGNWETKSVANTGVPALIKDIEENAQNAVIYRVGFGSSAHSFIILVRAGKTEILQSFAGGEGEALGENIENQNYQYTIEELTSQLSNMVSDKKTARKQAQLKLFEGVIDEHSEPGDGLTETAPQDVRQFSIRVDRRQLLDDRLLHKTIKNQIQKRVKAFNKITKK
ncbi:MAG: hypothetical protein RMX96_28435 [Nostoc sp. ChiSLP02]|nr:hypothetical protein [Nostoc sp. DedSLP05]MDZ8102029.1 hypothetical protein [Nostoc sp. DedSLP01]MDZ8188766.1 hypothetical protein [Nostoc sp. ChiSLP02]